MVLGGHYGCPVDIWALGCTVSGRVKWLSTVSHLGWLLQIFKVITGRSLFHARRKKKENLLAEMIAVLGEIPVEVVNEGRKSHRYFEENKSE